MQFEFADKIDGINYCVDLASKLSIIDDQNIHQILKSQYIIEKFDSQKLKQLCKVLCNPTQINLFLGSKEFENKKNNAELWYGTNYRS